MAAGVRLTICCARLDFNLVVAGTVVADKSDAAGELRDKLGIESSSDLPSLHQTPCVFLGELVQTLAES